MNKDHPSPRSWASQYREPIAGLAAGIATTLAVHPLDVIKTRLQRQTLAVARTILLNGPRDVYRGLLVNVVSNGVSWSAYFALYNELLHRFPGQFWTCAVTAGTLTSLVSNPLWVLKTRIVATSAQSLAQPPSIGKVFRSIYQELGWKGYWRGFVPGLFGVAQGSVQFAIYENLKRSLALHRTEPRPLRVFDFVATSAISKSIATVLLYPYQVVRTRMQFPQRSTHTLHGSATEIMRCILKTNGIVGFYKGLAANLLRVVPATCITFTVYEFTKLLLTD